MKKDEGYFQMTNIMLLLFSIIYILQIHVRKNDIVLQKIKPIRNRNWIYLLKSSFQALFTFEYSDLFDSFKTNISFTKTSNFDFMQNKIIFIQLNVNL